MSQASVARSESASAIYLCVRVLRACVPRERRTAHEDIYWSTCHVIVFRGYGYLIEAQMGEDQVAATCSQRPRAMEL